MYVACAMFGFFECRCLRCFVSKNFESTFFFFFFFLCVCVLILLGAGDVYCFLVSGIRF